ncbi:MAG: glycosyltransferase family 4 protein [Thermoleophilaceae bacterium]|nr:glycosyltransferase family 4 protein [Thermoleophilaceae bacterium]
MIDARAAARSEVGGVERVTRELADWLPRLAPGRYRVMRPPAFLAHKAGHAWEQAVLPWSARKAELILCPANLAPVASRRTVLLLHDVVALRHPEWYGRLYAGYQRALLPLLARRARLVLTVSEFSRREIVDVLGIPEERIRVVPNGVDERFRPDADPEPARAAHALARPYVLAVGTRIARKNLDALGPTRAALDRAGIDLVAAGSPRDYMRDSPDPPVRSLGYVADEHLPGLYAGARALVMPSLYEGFGLPCLEAMASGVPVVAADRTALPEVCGDAALLVDPDDQEALAAAVVAAATDEGLRERLRPAGLERAARFTWRATAEAADGAIAGLLRAR